MQGFVDALTHTPWWVYALFVFLLVRGVQARRPRVVAVMQLAVWPIIMTLWSSSTLWLHVASSTATVLAWALAMGVGAGFGHLSVRHRQVRADHQLRRIALPGDTSLLPLVLAIFCLKYAFGYLAARNPGLWQDPVFYYTDIIVSGMIAGIFLGKCLGYRALYRAAPSEPLAMQPTATGASR